MKEIAKSIVSRLINYRSGGAAAARWMGVTVGENCRILSLLFGSEPWLVSVGSNVTISSGVRILTHDGVGWLYRDQEGRRFRYARVEIGSDVFVGIGSIIMPGVKVGDRCVIGAGSVVTKSIPDGSVVAGNPARLLMSYDSLMEKVSTWPSEASIKGLSYEDGINSIVDRSFVSALLRSNNLV
ncbi:acyltransferase [Pseudarthrobacter chlorophenolicus]|uniref:acyltransferase n=1 Tax=Pseudarthrobacter chlorophenolicus TaxID=85085 RepID=UPI0009E59B0E|nr:acyltransferase [Pseudarthrobacter chlorophenolicus]